MNFRNADGDTPLLAACRRGHSDTVALLLAHGADSNLTGVDSLAPVHICAKRGDSQTLDALLEANTNPSLKTRDGQTALDIAKAKGHEMIYSRLMRQRSTLPVPRSVGGGGNAHGATSNPLSIPIVSPSSPSPASLPSVIPPLGSLSLSAPSPRVADREGLSSGSGSRREREGNRTNNRINNSGTNSQTTSNSVRSDRRDNEGRPPMSGNNPSSSSSQQSYALMGQSPVNSSSTFEDDQQIIALRRILDAEKVNRNILEAKVSEYDFLTEYYLTDSSLYSL